MQTLVERAIATLDRHMPVRCGWIARDPETGVVAPCRARVREGVYPSLCPKHRGLFLQMHTAYLDWQSGAEERGEK